MLLSDLQNVKSYLLIQIFKCTTILFTKKSATTADILCNVYYKKKTKMAILRPFYLGISIFCCILYCICMYLFDQGFVYLNIKISSSSSVSLVFNEMIQAACRCCWYVGPTPITADVQCTCKFVCFKYILK